MTYGLSITLPQPYDKALDRVRSALAEQGFGVLTEIDVTATLKAKLDVDMEDYIILGACNPPLAHQALDADRSIGLLLPCNVVVRAVAESETIVEVLDPFVMAGLSPAPTIERVANTAMLKLRTALETLRSAA